MSARWVSLSLSAWLLLTTLAPADPAPSVQLDSGPIRGEILDVSGRAIQAYKGIPFAAPPVGELRWRPPQAVAPWTQVRECRTFAPACPQPADMTYAISYRNQAEDCLYLNVWTTGKATEPLPVMVWIHGGGNLIGASYAPVYDGRHFAANGVVLVSIQYRLGVFGYLAHPELSAEAQKRDGHAASGNYGLMDQLAALRWVQKNIAAFGGDPKRVTIFGESAGAANVTNLMSSPLARGLFHRAIAQSGYFGENTPHLTQASKQVPSGHQTGEDVASRLGASSLKELRALSVSQLLTLPTTIGGAGRGGKAIKFGPVVDGHVLPRAPGEVWASGEMLKVPLIAGSNLDDGSVFSRSLPIRQPLGYRLAMNTIFGAEAEQALKLLPAENEDEVKAAVHRVTTLVSFRAPARRLARWMDAAGGQAWLYHFSRNPGKGRALKEGVFHGLEIGYVFNTLTSFGDATDKAIASDMIQRWIAFARTGDPNSKSLSTAWPRYRTSEDRHLEFGNQPKPSVGEKLDRELCDLLDKASSRRKQQP